MTEKERAEYVKSHDGFVRRAMSSVDSVLSTEEREDLSQELYCIMIRCIDNYNPDRKTKLDTYVYSSMIKAANGIVKRKIHGKYKSHDSLYMVVYHGNYTNVELIDVLPDCDSDFRDRIDSKVLVNEALDKIDPVISEMLMTWASGCGIVELAYEYGISPSFACKKIQRGLAQLRRIIDTGSKNEQLDLF